MTRAFHLALAVWCGLTVLVVSSVIGIQLRFGAEGFDLFIQQWALTNLSIMLASAALTWLCLGGLLVWLARAKITPANALSVLGFFLILFVYLNILRERFRYGDYAYYIEAGTALLEGRPLPGTYIYPPFWATLMEFIVPLGDQGVLLVLWSLNIVALGAFYYLLHRLLQVYGFPPGQAAVVTLVFMLANVPILRTLGFVQVNLLVMDFAFVAMLAYPRRPWPSAFALALAVQLKTSPVVLVLAFLLERDARWLLRFGLSFLAVAAIPFALHGIGPYVDFFRNAAALTSLGDTNFHETSIDSFLRFVGPFLRMPPPSTRLLVYVLKAALTVATLATVQRNVRGQTWVTGTQPGGAMLNSVPALFVLMNLLPPIVWDHHGLFVALPALLLLRRLPPSPAWVWFGFAYFAQFVMPSFDFFPWSFGRLVAPVILLALCWHVSSGAGPGGSALERWLGLLAASLPASERR
jgi:hypothetical protein